MQDVLFRGGGLDFEGYGVGVGVAEAEDLGDFVVEGACVCEDVVSVFFRLTCALVVAYA